MPETLYRQIATQIQSRRHGLAVPVKLPPEQDLAAEYQVARETLRRALRVLEHRGAITRRRGVGTFLQPVRPKLQGLNGRTVGLVPPPWATSSHWFTSVVFDGVSRWADEHNCSISVLHSDRRPVGAAAWAQRLADRDLAGIIWLHPKLEQLPVVVRTAQRLPTVVVGRHYPEQGLHCVLPDYAQAAQLIDRALFDAGHERYAIVGKNLLEPYTRQWIDAFEAAHRSRGLTFSLPSQYIDITPYHSRTLAQLLLDCYCPNEPNVKAFMFLTSGQMMPLLTDERFRQRLQRDLSIVTIDYGLYPLEACWPGRQIAHINCEWARIGQRTMEVLSLLSEGHEAPSILREPVRFLPGDTLLPHTASRETPIEGHR